jgi:phage terminase small subunit
MEKMTAKQQRFCDEYLIDLNATQAAIRAGYSKKTATVIGAENLTKPYIKEYIEKRMAEKESELIADQNEVLKYLTAVMRGKEKDERMVFGKDGVETAEIRNQENQMRAAELLGKRYGLYTDKVNETVDMNLNISIDYGDDK